MKNQKLFLVYLCSLLILGCNAQQDPNILKTYKGVVLTKENTIHLQSDKEFVLTSDTTIVQSKMICFRNSECTKKFDVFSDNNGYIDKECIFHVPGVQVLTTDTIFIKPIIGSNNSKDQIGEQINTLVYIFFKKYFNGLEVENCIDWKNIFQIKENVLNIEKVNLDLAEDKYQVNYTLSYIKSSCINLDKLQIKYLGVENNYHSFEFTDDKFVLTVLIKEKDLLSDSRGKFEWIKFSQM